MIITLTVFPLFYLTNSMYQFHGKGPPFGLCLFQAALIYAGPPTACAAVLCYILDVALGLYAAIYNKTRNAKWSIFILYFPAILFHLVFCVSVMAVQSEENVLFESAHMFCGAGAGSPHARLSAALAILALFSMLCVEGWIIVMLVRNWRKFRSFSNRNKELQLSVFIRFGVFTLVVGGSGTLSAFMIPENQSAGAIWNIFLVTVPFVAGLAFGTHKDLMKTWFCWITGRTFSSPVYEAPKD